MKRWRLAVSAAVGAALAVFLWSKPWAEWTEAELLPPEQVSAPAVYRADVRIDPHAHTAAGTLSVRFVPGDGQALFHLYPNAFHESADLSGANWEHILGKQRLPGGILITGVKVDGRPVPVRTLGKTETILQVPLEGAAGRRTEVEMGFELRVPYNSGRLSYNDHALWLGNWLPILAVQDETGWRLDPYYPMGDPFYSGTANYHLRVTLPDGYSLATSGTESQAVVTRLRPQGKSHYEVDAWNVRDFALVVMDDSYRQTVSRVGETVVRTWWQEGDSEETVVLLHDVAVRALRYYGEQFGTYPYREYDVVKTGGFFGGMEYPGIVFVQGDTFTRPNGMGAAVVAHETAHQWFYGLVGSDEVREAWVDESLADYAAMSFLEDERIAADGYIGYRMERGKVSEQYANRGLRVRQPLDRFPDWKSYSDLVYARGAAMWWKLRLEWGKERLHRVLRDYVREHQYKEAGGAELIEAFSRAVGEDAAPFFDYWLGMDLEKRDEAEAWMRSGRPFRIF
jgi:Peptidase family M1 domain